MITGSQIRAAFRWTTKQVAFYAGITSRTIKKLEQVEGIPDALSSTLVKIQNTLEAAGIKFINTPEGSPGIRLRLAKS